MENIESKNQQAIEKSAENILLKVFLQRHGPKFSASGEKNKIALYFGESVEQGFDKMNIQAGSGLVHLSHSGVTRAEKTAEIDLDKLKNTEHRNKGLIIEENKLATPYQPIEDATDRKYSEDLEKIVKIQESLEPTVRALIEKNNSNFSVTEKEAEVRNQIDMQVLTILFDKQKLLDNGLQTSYEELADNLAHRYQGFLDHTQMLASNKGNSALQPKNEPYVQIDVSHSFPIMSFLKKYLVFSDGKIAKDMSAEDFFERTGGVIKESDSLAMDYELENNSYVIKIKGEFTKGKDFSGLLNLNNQYEQ